MKHRLLITGIAALAATGAGAQVLTREDSLNAGLIARNQATIISAYGDAKVEYDLRNKTGTANLTRNVLFLGHRFNNRISLFSELELEDAKVEGGEPGGEVSMEQMFLKFNINPDVYITAGLFIPRIGIINENHLPTTFNGNDRPFLEHDLIPATWRELGVGLYGRVRRMNGLNYSLALVNGLDASGFGSGEGIREGRFEGRDATASNMAVTGSLLYYNSGFRIQCSGYYGGSSGLVSKMADSLQLASGAFGTPVALEEANVQYFGKKFQFRLLGTAVQIPDAEAINRAYANNTPELMLGGYAEVSCNLLALAGKTEKDLFLFARYENYDLNYKVPVNGIASDEWRKQYIVTGLTFAPVKGVAVKLDYVYRVTGEPNPALQINPFPQAQPFYTDNGFINLGIGYSF